MSPARPEASVDVKTAGDIVVLGVSGLVDDRFRGFGTVGAVKSIVIDVSQITRMTSFGVRQWLKAMDALPRAASELLLVGCPTFFVDQLNMVLNFGGAGKVLSVVAPYVCPACGAESGELIDVLAERANLMNGSLPEKDCTRCGAKLEFDETPESYFSFVAKYAATSIQPATAELLGSLELYTSAESVTEKPPRIIKLIDGSVTYFRIIGRIGSMFRARPFLVGAEGEIVIDLADVDKFDPAGDKEWRRVLKSLSSQVSSVTVVDVKESFLAATGDSLSLAPNIVVASLLVPYVCIACGRRSHQSHSLQGLKWPPQFRGGVCSECSGATRHMLAGASLAVLRKVNTNTPPASAQLIAQREEILARAETDAQVAQTTEQMTAAAAATTSDAILGKFRIVRRQATRGIAEVFLAKQVGIGGFEKPVVLKKIQRRALEGREQGIERLLEEIKLAGRLIHPNIAQLLDVGDVDGALYLAMEYVHGKSLREVLERLAANNMAMPVPDVCFLAREVAQALEHAYISTDVNGQLLSVVHGDVAPQNVVVSYDGAIKMLDFGVARSVGEQADVQYMAPEGQVDQRSDLFSLGVLIYELCTGARPFGGSTAKDVVKKIRSGRYKALRDAAQVPDALSALVARLLQANAEERPGRAAEVVAELTEIMRDNAYESSGPGIARFVSRLFPDDTPGPDLAQTRPSSEKLDGQSKSMPIPRNTRGGIDQSVSLFAENAAPDQPSRVMKSPGQSPRRAMLLYVLLLVLLGVGVAAYLYTYGVPKL